MPRNIMARRCFKLKSYITSRAIMYWLEWDYAGVL